MKSLVLAEKPSVGKDIARVLQCRKPVAGGLEGEHYIVTWAYGHLVTLADPEQYEDRYKTWRMEDLPMLPDQMKLEVIRQTGKQYHAVKEQIFRKDIVLLKKFYRLFGGCLNRFPVRQGLNVLVELFCPAFLGLQKAQAQPPGRRDGIPGK